MNENNLNPKVGTYLYATCAGRDYGKIIATGFDPNNEPTIDVEIFHPNDLLSYDEDINPLTRLELNPTTKVVLRFVQYRVSPPDCIECFTPGDNCYRCTKFFTLNERPANETK